jgi:hypothetical protein
MNRSACAHSFARNLVRLFVLIVAIIVCPRPAEAAKECRVDNPCQTDQSCCTGFCFKTTGEFGTCRLPTARWHNGDVITFNQGDWGRSSSFSTPMTTAGSSLTLTSIQSILRPYPRLDSLARRGSPSGSSLPLV